MSVGARTPMSKAISPVEERYCSKCMEEGIKTLLFYSDPPKKSDTYSKALAARKDFRCKSHVARDGKAPEEIRAILSLLSQKEISNARMAWKQHKIEKFNEMWNNPKVRVTIPEGQNGEVREYRAIDLTEVDTYALRLMAVFEYYRIRTGDKGFAIDEMLRVIFEKELDYSYTDALKEYEDSVKHCGTSLKTQQELMSKIHRDLIEKRKAIVDSLTQKYTSKTKMLMYSGNAIWASRAEKDREMFVTNPKYTDPFGKKQKRYFLLTEREDVDARSALRRQRAESTEPRIAYEEAVQKVAKEHAELEEQRERELLEQQQENTPEKGTNSGEGGGQE
jgi:hypothetical protein